MAVSGPDSRDGNIDSDSLADHRDPMLLPTSSLSPDDFEDFTERLLNAHRFAPEPARRMKWVERWGRKGDSQDGIDFRGTWIDGTTAAWQCKRWDELSKADVNKIVADCSYDADEYYLTYSGEASRDARDAMDAHPKWRILDKRGLGQLFDDLPLHKKRAVLDDTWGVTFRKRFLNVPADDAFVDLRAIRRPRLREGNVLNDRAGLVGRAAERALLEEALDRSLNWPLVVLLTGPGGRGKTRLLIECLEAAELGDNPTQVLVLSPGRSLDGAALAELPHAPAIVVIDDVHREVAGLEALLRYALEVEGTQILLSYREQGPDPVAATVTRVGIPAEQTKRIALKPLIRAEAKQLVESLANGLTLQYEFKARLIEQAIDTPHIPVIALNLARAGKLGGPIAMDGDLRREVMDRYQDLLIEPVDGVSAGVVRRLLAAISALGIVNLNDGVVRAKLASFCSIDVPTLLTLVEAFEGRGLLSRTGDQARVVPDVLADQIVESVAAVAGIDSGFAADLWNAFAGDLNYRLLESLALLDWRLKQQGIDSVLDVVWQSIDDYFSSVIRSRAIESLKEMRSLPFVQPDRTMAVLEALNERLQDDGFADDVEPEPSGLARFFHTAPLGDDDVRAAMAPVYGSCVFANPEHLELALERLWAFSRTDIRRPNQHDDHPLRVIEKLADIGKMKTDDVAIRVTSWVSERVKLAGPSEAVQALTLLKPLLQKEGMRTRLVDRRTLAFEPYFVHPSWAKVYRSRIRDLLESLALVAQPAVASKAIEYLGELIRQPHGLMGAEVSEDDIEAWRDDDVLTLVALGRVENSVDSPVMKLLVRHELSWLAAYGVVSETKYAARQLIAEIDQRADVLCVALMNDFFDLEDLSSEIGMTYDDFLSRPKQISDPTDPQAVSDRVDHLEEGRRQAVELAAAHLRSLSPGAGVREIAERSAELAVVRPTHSVDLHGLAVATVTGDPDCITAVIDEVDRVESAELDGVLAFLLSSWLQSDEKAALQWIADVGDRRTGLRKAVGRLLIQQEWGSRAERFDVVLREGLSDPDPAVRDTYVLATHHWFRARPGVVTAELIDLGVDRATLRDVLMRAAQPDPREFGERLPDKDASAVLGLVEQAEWSDWTAGEVICGIATSDPVIVLEHFRDAFARQVAFPEVPGLSAVFDGDDVAVRWFCDSSVDEESDSLGAVVQLALGPRLLPSQAARFIARVPSLDLIKLRGVVHALSTLDVWPLREPQLAREIVNRARALQAAPEFLERISGDCRLTGWSSVNGVSDEVNEVRKLGSELGLSEPDNDLRKIYAEAGAHASSTATRLAKEEAADSDVF